MISNLHKVFSTLKTSHSVNGKINISSSFSTYFYNFKESTYAITRATLIKIKNSKLKTYMVFSRVVSGSKVKLSNSKISTTLFPQLKIYNNININTVVKTLIRISNKTNEDKIRIDNNSIETNAFYMTKLKHMTKPLKDYSDITLNGTGRTKV